MSGPYKTIGDGWWASFIFVVPLAFLTIMVALGWACFRAQGANKAEDEPLSDADENIRAHGWGYGLFGIGAALVFGVGVALTLDIYVELPGKPALIVVGLAAIRSPSVLSWLNSAKEQSLADLDSNLDSNPHVKQRTAPVGCYQASRAGDAF